MSKSGVCFIFGGICLFSGGYNLYATHIRDPKHLALLGLIAIIGIVLWAYSFLIAWEKA